MLRNVRRVGVASAPGAMTMGRHSLVVVEPAAPLPPRPVTALSRPDGYGTICSRLSPCGDEVLWRRPRATGCRSWCGCGLSRTVTRSTGPSCRSGRRARPRVVLVARPTPLRTAAALVLDAAHPSRSSSSRRPMAEERTVVTRAGASPRAHSRRTRRVAVSHILPPCPDLSVSSRNFASRGWARTAELGRVEVVRVDAASMSAWRGPGRPASLASPTRRRRWLAARERGTLLSAVKSRRVRCRWRGPERRPTDATHLPSAATRRAAPHGVAARWSRSWAAVLACSARERLHRGVQVGRGCHARLPRQLPR